MTNLGEKLSDSEINEMIYEVKYFNIHKIPKYLKKINKFPKFIKYYLWKY